MSDISPDLLSIIFLCVPAEHLLGLRYVCKAWCSVIDDPYFIRTHIAKWINNRDDSSIHVLHLYYNEQPCLLSMNSFNYDDINSIQFVPQRVTPNTSLWSPKSKFFTCNGLILIQKNLRLSSWSIINPLTQESFDLPCLSNEIPSESQTTGFGYDSATDDYKIVTRFYYDEKSRTFIYSLKSNSWKEINNDYSFSISYSRGVFCNGALHWIGKSEEEESLMIIAFDLESEEFQFYSLPYVPPLPDWIRTETTIWKLKELGGSLSLIRYVHFSKEIRRKKSWGLSTDILLLMGNYRDGNSWSTLYSMSSEDSWVSDDELKPLSYSASKEFLLLIQKNSNKLLLVNLKHNTTETREVPLNTLKGYSLHRPSFVRITEIANNSSKEQEAAS